MDCVKNVDQLGEDGPHILLGKMPTRFDLHEVPEVSVRVEWEDHRYILVIIDDDVFELANALDADEVVHNFYLLFDVLEKIFLADLFDAHVLQAVEQVVLLVLAEAAARSPREK